MQGFLEISCRGDLKNGDVGSHTQELVLRSLISIHSNLITTSDRSSRKKRGLSGHVL